MGRVWADIVATDWTGWDPYDGLMTGRAPASWLLRSRLTRIVLIQGMKRSPFNWRHVLRVPRLKNPKAVALGLESACTLARLPRITPDPKLEGRRLVENLCGLAKDSKNGAGWGYPFDWQARAFWIPRDTPTVVCTGFVVRALDRARRELPIESDLADRAAQAMRRAAAFVENDLNVTRDEHGFCWSYSPLDHSSVVNASLLGAETVARVAAMDGDASALDRIEGTIRWCFSRQAEHGGWPYGEAGHHQWEDSFHTGFNLASLRAIREAAEELGADADALVPWGRVRKAYDHYSETFFDPDGRPWYYSHTPWPIDPHAAAVAVLTHLAFADEVPEAAERARRTLDWTIEHMWVEKGWFAFQKWRWGRIDIPYLRWCQAWMLLALAEWVAFEERTGTG